MTSASKQQPYEGPHLLSYGFRPFFLLGSIFAGAAAMLWLPMYLGEVTAPTAFSPRDWHVHEMLFGFIPAIIAGFLLTAMPNWTGRPVLRGGILLALVAMWLAGRLACLFSALIGWKIAMAIDLGFLAMLAAAASREIVASENWRNLRVVGAVVLILLGNAIFHVEAAHGGAEYGFRLGLGAIVVLVALIGGRIIPAFTRNVLVRQNAVRLPAPFSRLDGAAMIATGAALALWVVWPISPWTSAGLGVAAALNAIRMARWAGDQTWRDRLLLVLHVAYAFLPAGLLLLAIGAADTIPASAGIHVLTMGCIGLMTLAVMSRASLGHTGRPLKASGTVQAIYVLVVAAMIARVGAVLAPEAAFILLHVAVLCWALAFLGFAIAYGKVFVGPPVK